MELANSIFSFTPLSKEIRYVISAYTGYSMCLPEEIDGFCSFVSEITGKKINQYFDLLNPTVFDIARKKVTYDFMRLVGYPDNQNEGTCQYYSFSQFTSPLAWEVRSVLTAYTGFTFIRPEEDGKYREFLSRVTQRIIESDLDLYTICKLAKARVMLDYLKLYMPQEVLEAYFLQRKQELNHLPIFFEPHKPWTKADWRKYVTTGNKPSDS